MGAIGCPFTAQPLNAIRQVRGYLYSKSKKRETGEAIFR